MKDWLKKISFKKDLIVIIFTFSLSLFLFLVLFSNNFNFLKISILITSFLLLVLTFFMLVFLKTSSFDDNQKISFDYFKNILNSLQEALVVYDKDYKIVFVNRSFSDLVGLKKEDLETLEVGQWMIKNEKYELLANIFFPFLQGDDIKIISQKPEIISVHFIKPKERFFLISFLNIFLDKEYRLRIILDKTSDIFENQKRLEFTQLVSHNLLTPLNQIRWLLESVNLEKEKDFSENQLAINDALNVVKNSINFASSILTFLRTESGRLVLNIKEVILKDVFDSILDLLSNQIKEKSLKVEIKINEGARKIIGDLNLIKSAFFSIIENAVFYNKNNGLINIFVEKETQRPYVKIIIKDSGIGMSQEDLLNIFKKYYRGKKTKDLMVNGFGIGLYNARSIINLHGGEIKVESEEDKGTTITILWPIDPIYIPKNYQDLIN